MEKDLEGLNIDDGEEEEAAVLLPIDTALQKATYEYCLVGCFLTSSVVHFSAMKTTMANLWHPLRDHDVEDDPIVPVYRNKRLIIEMIVPNVSISTYSFEALVEQNNAYHNQISAAAKGQAGRTQ
ncbi:hypothetical protein Gotur_032532 [Gossypium turneri]